MSILIKEEVSALDNSWEMILKMFYKSSLILNNG